MSTPNIPDQTDIPDEGGLPEGDQPGPATADDGTPLGSLTVEDDPEGTVDPAELAGTADESDEDVS